MEVIGPVGVREQPMDPSQEIHILQPLPSRETLEDEPILSISTGNILLQINSLPSIGVWWFQQEIQIMYDSISQMIQRLVEPMQMM